MKAGRVRTTMEEECREVLHSVEEALAQEMQQEMRGDSGGAPGCAAPDGARIAACLRLRRAAPAFGHDGARAGKTEPASSPAGARRLGQLGSSLRSTLCYNTVTAAIGNRRAGCHPGPTSGLTQLRKAL